MLSSHHAECALQEKHKLNAEQGSAFQTTGSCGKTKGLLRQELLWPGSLITLSSRQVGDQKTRSVCRREHESAALSSSKSNTLITFGPWRNLTHSTPVFCSHVVKQCVSHTHRVPAPSSLGTEAGAKLQDILPGLRKSKCHCPESRGWNETRPH